MYPNVGWAVRPFRGFMFMATGKAMKIGATQTEGQSMMRKEI